MQIVSSKPNINNVVATADLTQAIDITRFLKYPWGIYDQEIYGGRCGYIKTPEMDGKVTIFPSGKMISVGAKSIKKAKDQINQAKFLLLHNKFIVDIEPKVTIQNIVATSNCNTRLDLYKIMKKIEGATYNPENFPGIILKKIKNTSFLIFASGKIVLNGSKSLEDLNSSEIELIKRLELAMH